MLYFYGVAYRKFRLGVYSPNGSMHPTKDTMACDMIFATDTVEAIGPYVIVRYQAQLSSMVPSLNPMIDRDDASWWPCRKETTMLRHGNALLATMTDGRRLGHQWDDMADEMAEAYDVFDVTDAYEMTEARARLYYGLDDMPEDNQDYGFVVEHSKPLYEEMPRWAESITQEVCDELVAHLDSLLKQQHAIRNMRGHHEASSHKHAYHMNAP